MVDCQKPDAELVRMSLENPDYFGCIMEKYEQKLLSYILRISNVDSHTADDILQEVFLKVYKNLHDYHEQFSFSSWVYRITHNHTISTIRKIKVRPQTISMESDTHDFLNMFESDVNISKDLQDAELAEAVQKVFQDMPEKYRTVLVLRYLEDKSYEEMSDILQESVGTVSTKLNRAKKAFKQAAYRNHLIS